MVLNTCKLFSLNVRGINNFRKRRTIFTWCRKKKGWPYLSAGILWKTLKDNGKMNGVVIWLCHAEVQIHAELPFFSGFDCTVLSKFEDPLGRYLILKALSFFVVGRLGRKEKRALGARWEGKERREAPAFSLFPSSPAPFLFFRLLL